MEKFLEAYKMFRDIKSGWLGTSYRFCWIPFPNGSGMYTSIEFYDEELPKLDPNKIEILQL